MKKIIIISAVNLRSGGPLSILIDCLSYAQNNLLEEYRIIALVHDSTLLNVDGIELIEFKDSASSYVRRLYYEYFYFKKISEKYNPFLWLSLHDITPNVTADIKAVYCHNAAPFYRMQFKDILIDPFFFLFNSFYKYLYRINIKKNNYVIVQQDWLRTAFKKMYGIKRIIVAHPDDIFVYDIPSVKKVGNKYRFFYPTLSRFFKNIEVIGEAVKILNEKDYMNFEVIITIDGTENYYAKSIVNLYEKYNNIKLIGRVDRKDVFKIYANSDCLLIATACFFLQSLKVGVYQLQNLKQPANCY